LGGDVTDVLLLDVTPLTLSIETLGRVATPLIERNTTIPTRKSQVFSTATDNQMQVEIHVLQGERPMAQDNKSLGKFILDGIPQAPRGMPQVEVVFDIDANGILNVTAKDKATNKEQSMQIIPSSGLADEEIERMVKDAEIHEEEDTMRKSLIEAKNQAENLVFATEKTLTEQAEHISDDVKQEIEAKLEHLKSVKESDDIDGITSATADLGQAIQKVGEQMYGSQPDASDPSEDVPPPTDQDQDQDKGSKL